MFLSNEAVGLTDKIWPLNFNKGPLATFLLIPRYKLHSSSVVFGASRNFAFMKCLEIMIISSTDKSIIAPYQECEKSTWRPSRNEAFSKCGNNYQD